MEPVEDRDFMLAGSFDDFMEVLDSAGHLDALCESIIQFPVLMEKIIVRIDEQDRSVRRGHGFAFDQILQVKNF